MSGWKNCDIDVKVFISEPCQAMKCNECEGIYNKERPFSEWTFCTHECHLRRNRDCSTEPPPA